MAAGGKLYIGKSEVNSFSEFDQIQIQSTRSDVFQFNEFGVRIVWIAGVLGMVHNLGDTQVICDMTYGKYRLVQCAPYTAVQHACLEVSGSGQGDCSAIWDCAG